MADAYFFVDPVNGNDTTGTGDWSAPTKTIGKAIATSGLFTLSTTGTNYLAIMPGICREVVSLAASPTSGGPLVILGDVDGAIQKAAGSTSIVTGAVEWRGWSSDTVRLTTNECLIGNNKNYVTVQNIKFIGSGNSTSTNGCIGITGTSANWTVQDCVLEGTQAKPYCISVVGTAGQAMNVVVKRCVFATNGSGMGVQITMPTHSAEYDANILVQNCRFFGCSSGVRFTPSGAAAFNPTGLTIQNCGFFFSTTGVTSQLAVGINNTTPIGIYNCTFAHGSNGLVGAANATHVVEDGNQFDVTTPRSASIAAGSNSITTYCPAFEFDDGLISGQPLRPFGTPSAVGVVGGWGSYGTPPAVDGTNRPRPAGFGSTSVACGALERHRTVRKETTTVDAGGVGWAIDGPGDDSIECAVDATTTTVAVKARYDTLHAATNKPYAVMRANPELGVSEQTVTMSAAVDTWETLTFGPFSPSAAGAVVIDIYSRSAAGGGKAFFDTGAIS